jgi:dTDP-4-dehydrorhamnose 3,5-epimerase
MASIQISSTALPEVKLVLPRKFMDDRGYFVETYNQKALIEGGIDLKFVQDNHSLSTEPGTLRGLHFQREPYAQDKLVRVVKGRVWDVAVDIRKSSPTYRQWVGVELGAENQLQLLIPVGFAHGFVTLEPNTEVIYKVTAHYDPASDAGIAWDDPDIAVDWKLGSIQPVLSAKDQALPRLSNAQTFS